MARSKMSDFIEQIFHNTLDYKGIIFLDRDGTINDEEDYLRGKLQLHILPTVVDGIKLLNKHKIAVVVITNQPVVARGIISVKELVEINKTLYQNLKKKGAIINAIYSCPHHPEKNHKDIPQHALKFRLKCECRKPGILMYKKALQDYKVHKVLGVIGDQTRDIQAASDLKTSGILLKTGYSGSDNKYDVKPDFICDNFVAAVKLLLH